MCGICGYFNSKNVNVTNDSIIKDMMQTILHRGVNGSDHYINGSVALGFTRLSIIGVSNGMQPIISEDGSTVLICNGEIYNYVELKKQLIGAGHRFKTDSDVEVILHLYEDYGEVAVFIVGSCVDGILDGTEVSASVL